MYAYTVSWRISRPAGTPCPALGFHTPSRSRSLYEFFGNVHFYDFLAMCLDVGYALLKKLFFVSHIIFLKYIKCNC